MSKQDPVTLTQLVDKVRSITVPRLMAWIVALGFCVAVWLLVIWLVVAVLTALVR